MVGGWKGQRIRKKTGKERVPQNLCKINTCHTKCASQEPNNDDCFDEKTMLSSEIAALRISSSSSNASNNLTPTGKNIPLFTFYKDEKGH
ncbi:unnamed protein product [Brugia timori]|uniref:Uncharacterized protein n=1 Tax=Brugia timori TaxID=42155 RepID=A0A0R3QY93_9BILA|nr:unnamed protein product [Brugia timori]